MRVPTHVFSLAMLGGFLALCGCIGGPPPVPEPPAPVSPVDPVTHPLKFKDYNLVFVSFDALQAAHVSALGYPRRTTPGLDVMARKGINFTRAYSVASWTVPASMTWFTGVYPSEHRMTNKFAVYNAREQKRANLRELSPELLTLAEVLKANGYATAGFTGNAGVSGGFGYDQGFDVYSFDPGVFGGMDRSIPRALEWLARNRHRKFFLFLHGYDAHGQNTPAGGLDYRFVERDYDGRFTGSEQEQELLREEGLQKGRVALRDADVRFWRAVYDEKINRADERFRQFLARLDRLGLTGKTLFVLTSDHGTEFHEHGRFDHGFTLYEEQVRVPVVVKLPGQVAGRAVPDRVSSIDVMPTVLDLLDVPLGPRLRRQMRGASLVPAMKGERVRRDIISETDYREYTYKRSLVTPDGWKLICTMESGRRELYDLNTDPGEQRDRAAAEPGRVEELRRRLYAHFKAIGHDLEGRKWQVGLNPVYDSQGREVPGKE